MRLKVQTLRTLLWLGNGLVFAAILVLFVNIFRTWRNSTRQYLDASVIETAANAPASITPTQANDGRASIAAYSSVWDLNVTGKDPVVERGPADDTPTVAAVPPIKDELRIQMAVTSSDVALRTVKVEYIKQAAQPEAPKAPADATVRSHPAEYVDLLGEGDVLKDPYGKPPYNAKIVQISSDEVIFSWGGKEEALEVPKVVIDRTPISKLPSALEGEHVVDEPAKPDFDTKESRKLDDGSWFIGTEEIARIQRDQDALINDLELSTIFDKTDRRTHLMIKKLPKDSPIAQRGFEEGDTIRSINSREVTSRHSIRQFFKENPGLSQYRVEIDRRGQKMTLVFKVPR